MPKKQDYSQNALSAIERLIGEPLVEKKEHTPPKNPAAVALGRLGGAKGGPARAASLTSEERKAIAQKAAKARWGDKKAQIAKILNSEHLTGKQVEEKLGIKPPSVAALKAMKKKVKEPA